MVIGTNIEFFTQDAPADTPPGIGTLMTMFSNSKGSLGIGSLMTLTSDVSEFPLLRGPQSLFEGIGEDRLAKITVHALGTVAGIDLTASGVTTVFTAPADKTVLIFGVLLEATAADIVTIVPSISLGLNPSTTDVFAIEPLVTFDTVGELFSIWPSINKAVTIADGGVLDLDVAVAATATTLTATARVIGIIL